MRKISWLVIVFTLLVQPLWAGHLEIIENLIIKDIEVLAIEDEFVIFRGIDQKDAYEMDNAYVESLADEVAPSRLIIPLEEIDKIPTLVKQRKEKRKLTQQLARSVSVNSLSEACSIYEINKKDPYIGGAFSLLVPSLGHAYAGDWDRGVKFLLLELALLGASLISIEDSGIAALQGIAIPPVLFLVKVLEIYDSVDTVGDYNMGIKEELRIEFVPQKKGVGIRVKLKY